MHELRHALKIAAVEGEAHWTRASLDLQVRKQTTLLKQLGFASHRKASRAWTKRPHPCDRAA